MSETSGAALLASDQGGEAPSVAPNRSEAGGWSGQGLPEHGDFVRPLPSGSTHIVASVDEYRYALTACRKGWYISVLRPSHADHPRRCAVCWEAM